MKYIAQKPTAVVTRATSTTSSTFRNLFFRCLKETVLETRTHAAIFKMF